MAKTELDIVKVAQVRKDSDFATFSEECQQEKEAFDEQSRLTLPSFWEHKKECQQKLQTANRKLNEAEVEKLPEVAYGRRVNLAVKSALFSALYFEGEKRAFVEGIEVSDLDTAREAKATLKAKFGGTVKTPEVRLVSAVAVATQ